MIRNLSGCQGKNSVRTQIYEIFFQSAARQEFDTEQDRLDFRDMWLDRYLTNFEDQVLVYTKPDNNVVGYLTGCRDSLNACQYFEDVEYYSKLKHFYRDFPAHFHINVRSECRNHGIGQHLVESFIDECSASLVPGVHIVTAENSRNVRFYQKCAFHEVTTTQSGNRNLVMMGRSVPELGYPALSAG